MPVQRVGSEFLVNTTTAASQSEPAVTALADGRFVVTWTDASQTGVDVSNLAIRGRIFNADGSQSAAEFLVNTTTPDAQTESAVTALADGRFVVVWTDDSATGGDTSGGAIRGRIFNADGTQSVAEFLVNTTTINDQFNPAVTTLADGRFVVTWTDYSTTGGDTSDGAIRGRIFNADGSQSVAEFLINTTTSGFQATPDVTALSDGRFLVTWNDDSQSGGDTSGTAVRGRIFNPDGSQSVAEFLVNTTSLGAQFDPSITALTDGRFVVTWTDNSATGGDMSAGAIRGRIFNADGSQSVGEFLVNTTTSQSQSEPSVTALADGRFVVTWRDASASGGDTSGQAIRGRIFNADGTQSAPEFIINTTTTNNQFQPDVTALADGRFVVTWRDDSATGGDTSSAAIRAQVFDPTRYDGTAAFEFVTGGSFDDWLSSYGGNDTLEGRGGDDRLFGGDGLDVLRGNEGNDWLDGGASVDELRGGADHDRLFGRGGSDQLFGDDGNDFLEGGAGGDLLNGGTGFDYASYANASSAVQVVLYSPGANTGDALNDSYTDIEGVIGSANADVLVGGFGVDVIAGGAGNDWIDGTFGGDGLFGEFGDDNVVSRVQADYLDGGSGFDTARYDYADAGLRAYLYDPTQNSGWAAGDAYVSIEGLAGSYFADDLRGDNAGNIIFGLGGADFIIGLGGSDLLIGGDGADLFHYSNLSDGGGGGDVIQDFTSGTDRISVTGAAFGLGSPGGTPIDGFRFVSGAAATLATSQFIYNPVTRQLFYDADGTGGGGQVLLATLQVGATLTATDIIVI